MKIKELTIQEFNDYTKNSPLKNYMQTEEYARLMGENKYNYDYIGLIDDKGSIQAASLILWKKIGSNVRYGYAPKGFLVNYYDESLLRTFTDKLREYYSLKNMAFIKINPEIVVGEINNKTFEAKENPNMRLKQEIQRFGFVKLKDNLYFESINPRFNAYVDLKNANFQNYSKVTRNKVRSSKRKGLYLVKGSESDLEEMCKTLKPSNNLSHYKTLFTIFKDKLELLLVRVNYENFVKNSQALYEVEMDSNTLYNEILHRSHKESDLNRKMASDSRLSSIKNEIITATEGLREHDNHIVAGALIVKFGNRVHILESFFKRDISILNANYFLYDSIIENYKTDYDYLDLGGITGDFKKTNPYRGLNRFKLGFNPKVFEYIGEFDFVINRVSYNNLLSSGKLASEFNKTTK